MNMCYLKDIGSLFLIAFSTGLIIGKIYSNEKRIYSLERNIFVLENKVEDLIDEIQKK